MQRQLWTATEQSPAAVSASSGLALCLAIGWKPGRLSLVVSAIRSYRSGRALRLLLVSGSDYRSFGIASKLLALA